MTMLAINWGNAFLITGVGFGLVFTVLVLLIFIVIFSLLKAFLILGLIIIAFNSLNTTFGFVKPEVLADSVLYTPLKNLADTVFPYIKNMLTLK